MQLVQCELETEKLLTISTAHITPQTANWLDRYIDDLPPVYAKGDYGWFIYIGSWWFSEKKPIPDDLGFLLQFCMLNKVDVLCLDSDAETLDLLPEYDWEEEDEDE